MQPWGELAGDAHEIVLGVPRSGKTELVRRRARSARRALFFDPPREHGAEGVVVTASELARYGETLLAGKWMRVVVQPEAGADVAGEFRTALAAARAARAEGGLLLVADEIGAVSDYGRRPAPELVELHVNGHKDGIASIVISQRAGFVPLGARATANRVLSLLQDHSADLAALSEVYGESYAASVAAWKPGDPPVEWARLPLRFPSPAA